MLSKKLRINLWRWGKPVHQWQWSLYVVSCWQQSPSWSQLFLNCRTVMDQLSKPQTRLLECGHSANLAGLSGRWLELPKRSCKTGKINARIHFCARHTASKSTTNLPASMWTLIKLKSFMQLETRWHMHQLEQNKSCSWVEKKSEHSQWWFWWWTTEHCCHFKPYMRGRHTSLVHRNLHHITMTWSVWECSSSSLEHKHTGRTWQRWKHLWTKSWHPTLRPNVLPFSCRQHKRPCGRLMSGQSIDLKIVL